MDSKLTIFRIVTIYKSMKATLLSEASKIVRAVLTSGSGSMWFAAGSSLEIFCVGTWNSFQVSLHFSPSADFVLELLR